MFADEIKDRLVAQGIGAFGTVIFIGSGAVIPVGDGPYVGIVETGGSGPDRTQNDTATQRPSAQISIRATNPVTARTKAKAAYDALGGANGLWNITLTGVLYLSIQIQQEPTDVGMDGTGKRTMYVFHINAEKAPS